MFSPSPNLFLSCTLLAVPVGSTLCMTFVSMATWVLLPLIPFDTCLCVWYYCSALLWFCWGVWHGLSESKTSIPFSYNFVVTIIVLCMHTLHLINSCLQAAFLLLWVVWMWSFSCIIVYCFRKCRWRLIQHHGLWWILLLLYSHLVHTSMSILDCPMLRDPSDQTVRPVSFCMCNQCFVKAGESMSFVPQARKLKEKCLYKGHELVIHSKVSTVSSHDICYSSSPAMLPSVNPKASGTINNCGWWWLLHV